MIAISKEGKQRVIRWRDRSRLHRWIATSVLGWPVRERRHPGRCETSEWIPFCPRPRRTPTTHPLHSFIQVTHPSPRKLLHTPPLDRQEYTDCHTQSQSRSRATMVVRPPHLSTTPRRGRPPASCNTAEPEPSRPLFSKPKRGIILHSRSSSCTGSRGFTSRGNGHGALRETRTLRGSRLLQGPVAGTTMSPVDVRSRARVIALPRLLERNSTFVVRRLLSPKDFIISVAR
ncbi:hypothetical protein BH20GEM2_BH20GEM2_01840 [soil metagenome]